MAKDRTQVADQCKVVAHLATALAQVHTDYEAMMRRPDCPGMNELVDQVGRRTASFMEQLGDMINAMDAVDEEDAWTNPIFEEAQRLWPITDTARLSEGSVDK